MPKCGLCGKFLSSNDCVRCAKCAGSYHRLCGSAPATGPTPPGWSCQTCKNRSAKTYLSPDDKVGQADESVDMTLPTNLILSELTKEIKSLRNELGAMRLEFSEFKTELLTCSNRVAILEEKVVKIEEKIHNNTKADINYVESTISELKQQLDERDQELLLNDLEISGLPENSNESILHLTKLMALKLGIQLDDRDVVFAERLGFVRRNRTTEEPAAKQRPRTVIIRLARRALREELLRAARIRRGLTTTDIEMPGESRKFYMNERLTRRNRKLFGKVREAAAHQKWKYVWTKNGNIFARKDDGKAAIRVRAEADVSKIFCT